MGRRKDSRRTALQGGALSLADYGRPDLPGFSWDSLPGDDAAGKTRAYVDALDLDSSVERGALLFRVECVLDAFVRERARLPSFEDEVLS